MGKARLVVHPKDKRRQSKLVYVRYTYAGKVKYFSTGVSIPAQDLLTKGGTVTGKVLRVTAKKRNRNLKRINGKLRDVEKAIERCEDENLAPSINEVESFVNLPKDPQPQHTSIDEVYREYLSFSKETKRPNTIKTIVTAWNDFSAFLSEDGLSQNLNAINDNYYSLFIIWLGKKGLSANSRDTRVKNIKTLLRYAVNTCKIELNVDTKKWKVSYAKNDANPLLPGELARMKNLDLSKSPRLERIRDLFLFQCLTGLRNSDLFALNNAEHVSKGILEITAIKNRGKIRQPLHLVAIEILERYEGNLPKLSEQKYRAYVREVCRLAKVGQRHPHNAVDTFISNCLNHWGFSVPEVAAMTGKSESVIFRHYVKADTAFIAKKMKQFDPFSSSL